MRKDDGGPRLPLLSAFNDFVEQVATGIAVVLLIIFCVIVGWEAFSRYVLNDSRIWAEEAARLAFVWSLFLAAAVGFRRNEHLAVDVFSLPERSIGARVHDVLIQLLNIAVLVFYAALGWRVAVTGFNRSFLALPLPMAVGWGAIPVMGILGILFAVERLLIGPALRHPSEDVRDSLVA